MADTSPATPDALKKLFPWLTYMPSWAPRQLVQPINQGWTFGNVMITTQNSSAPGIEHAIASKVSYGRQIGRLMDAVEVLVAKASAETRKHEAITDFVDLAKEVRKVKKEAQTQRLDQLTADLEALKREDPDAWKALVKGLRA